MKAKRLLLLPMLFVLGACSFSMNANGSKGDKEGSIDPANITEISSDSLANQATSAFSAINVAGTAAPGVMARRNAFDLNAATDQINAAINLIADDLGDMLYEFDVLITNKGEFTNSRTVSDRPEYGNKEVVSYRDNNETDVSLVIYYNDVSEAYRAGKDDTQVHFKYDGIVEFANNTFPFVTTLDTEKGGEKVFADNMFKLYFDTTKTNYVVVSSNGSMKKSIAENKSDIKIYLENQLVMNFDMQMYVVGNKVQIDFNFKGNAFSVIREEVENDTFYRVSVNSNLVEGISVKVTLNYKKVITGSVATFEYGNPTIGQITIAL